MNIAFGIIFGLLWTAGWVLAWRLRRIAPRDLPRREIKLSLIIPARNEAHNLPRLLGSLAGQSLAVSEVLVVDDGSSDETAAVARAMGATVIASAPLPDGWRGKTWACHQGALASQGDWLLFMDADTWLEPGGLARVLGFGLDGALSVVPYHAVRRSYEDFSLFFNICMAAGTVPNGLAGQVLLVSRADYQKAGGHAAVRGKILENFRLVEQFRANGVTLRCVTGHGMISFRMYPGGLSDVVEGWTKGFAAGAGGTQRGIMMLVVAWLTGLMLAPVMALVTGDWLGWGVGYAVASLQVAWLGRRLGSFGWLLLCYPLPLVFFFALFGWSAMRSGKRVTWKGRDVHAD
jgi:4,4'-diaponeurosporenoate glycosyltransferase